MPKIYPLALLLLMLAGCGRSTEETTPPDAGAAADSAPADPNASADVQGNTMRVIESPLIPVAFHGVYDRDGAACGSAGGEERLEITETELRFHESLAEVRFVRPASESVISLEADFEGEGESWRNRLRLSLGAGGTLTVTQPDGSSLTRIPCP